MEIVQLKDNRWIGCVALEVMSIPHCSADDNLKPGQIDSNYTGFLQLVKEFYNLSGGEDRTSLEILWMTETVENQAFSSKIHLYIILRHIGNEKSTTESFLNNLSNLITVFLESRQYETKEVGASEEVGSGMPQSQNLLAIVKREKYTGNMFSPFPYYYCDIIPNDSSDNFQSLISLMSQHKDCAIIFQLFPVRFSQQEVYLLQEMDANFSRLTSGIYSNGQIVRDPSADEPHKVYSYYCERVQAPLYKYNILVSGSRETCSVLAAKVISLLQSGKTKIVHEDFGCLDLTRENLNLNRSFLFYPWNVNNKLIFTYRNQNLLKNFPTVNALKRLPYILAAEEVTVFFRLPLFERGMAALRSSTTVNQAEQFDDEVTRSDNVKLGAYISGNLNNLVIGCPLNTFTKHGLVVGVPGSGKTTFAFHLLMQFHYAHIPFLAIEPTKSEYRGMIDAIPNLQIFTPGNSLVSPFILNPFIPPKGITIEQFVPSLANAFKAAFAMPSPLDVIFLRAIRECYVKFGWKDYNKAGDPGVTVFGLFEFILVFRKIIAESTYSREVKGNLESGGVFRLLNLIEQNRAIFDNVNTVPVEDLLERPTVIELNSIENAEQKALIMALLLINICSYIKCNRGSGSNLRNILMIDEAHVLLGNSSPTISTDGAPDPRGATIKAIQDMIAEIRSYGMGIIIADQSPAKVSREVVAQTELKVAFRLVQSLDKQLIADTTNMDERICQQLSKLRTGEAYVYYSKLEAPVLIMTPDIRNKLGIKLSVPDITVRKRMTYWNSRQKALRPYRECQYSKMCNEKCDFRIRSDADFYAKLLSDACSRRIKSGTDLLRYLGSMDKFLLRLMKTEQLPPYFERLVRCVTIKFYRNIQLTTTFRVAATDLERILCKPVNSIEDSEP